MDVGRGEPKNNGIVKPIVGGTEPPVSSKIATPRDNGSLRGVLNLELSIF